MRYTQPFFVPLKMARRLGFDRPFYLRPLEFPLDEENKPFKEKPVSFNGIDELKCKFIYLQNKINSHIDASKRKHKSYKYK